MVNFSDDTCKVSEQFQTVLEKKKKRLSVANLNSQTQLPAASSTSMVSSSPKTSNSTNEKVSFGYSEKTFIA